MWHTSIFKHVLANISGEEIMERQFHLTTYVHILYFQASFNPQDNTQLCVVGNGIFRNFRYSEGNLKAFNFQKMEPQNFLCHAWVSEERVVVGTDTGKLLLFENGEIKNEFNIGASFQDK